MSHRSLETEGRYQYMRAVRDAERECDRAGAERAERDEATRAKWKRRAVEYPLAACALAAAWWAFFNC